MGGHEAKLTGPDLEAGIPEGDLVGEAPLVGHAHGEAVLLLRRNDDVLAIGATCTHYGGPLADGLFGDDTVRCPWHHACFDLRSGAPVRGPALNPIPCYEVAVSDGLIRVGARTGGPITLRRSSALRTIAIVGAGAAGESAAETLRREGYDGEILLFGADDAPPVDRPNLSKDYLAGTAPEEWMPLRPPAFFGEQKIALATGARVESIDPAGHKLTLADGRDVSWDALLLATGAEPVRPPLPGGDQPHVLTLRTLADSRAIIERATRARKAVVVGASFIGMEVAASLRARGLEVHVVAPEAVPFERTLGPELGGFLRGVHEEHGVRFHLGHTVAAVEPDAVTLSRVGERGVSPREPVAGGVGPSQGPTSSSASDERLTADLVVLGVGVRPSFELARAAGLNVDRGIVVDDRLRTSAAGVYAAGDVARYPYAPTGEQVRIEHWVVAGRMGRVAALNMLGGDLPFTAPPFFWTSQYDVSLSYVGHAESWDKIDVHGDLGARDATLAYRRGGQTLAVATVGRDRTSLEAEVAIEAGDQATLAAFGRTR